MPNSFSEYWHVITGACTAAVGFVGYTVRSIARLDKDKVGRDELNKVIEEMRVDRKEASDSRRRLHEKFDDQAKINREVAKYLGRINGKRE